MYIMQLHSAYGACVGVKGNYAQPVYFPQLDDVYFLLFLLFFLFFLFPFCLKVQTSAQSHSFACGQTQSCHKH